MPDIQKISSLRSMTADNPVVLVTGGAGYIGTHTVLELLNAGYDVVVVDNLCNSTPTGLKRVEELTGRSVDFIELDLLNQAGLEAVFKRYYNVLKRPFEAVLHFAGLKAVGESVQKPLEYYYNNFTGTICLLETMKKFGCFRFIFSSSATVYGNPETLPLTEKSKTGATNPYGRTKLFIEEMLKDLTVVPGGKWQIISLRYFNPVGSHPSGRIGEDPRGVPNNLMPFVSQVAVGKRPHVNVFGNDYPTPDGTGVRDYIHVVDLAKGHLAALDKIKTFSSDSNQWRVYNLGTGIGYSVLEMVNAMEKASGQEIKTVMCDRRAGDVAAVFADPMLANKELKWKAELGLQEMCDDLWRWQSMNPNGFS